MTSSESAAEGTSGNSRPAPLVVGVLSDTHGHLYRPVTELLRGVDHLVHAGDIGSPEILRALRVIAPVTAVRGNVDAGAWADALPSRAELELGGVRIVVGHIAPRPDGAGRPEQPLVVIAGHTHLAAVEQRGEVLYLNPGSAGPRRFGRPRTIALLEIRSAAATGTGGGCTAEPADVTAAPRVAARIITVGSD